ncbi:Type VI secretion system (T6SS), amidase effector protein 4 [Paraburkholderia lycopersici]|uniref:Type VI secretion system (T6SS), amidase effector protein 4 n=1 Tax=Paraburkholderia lycopersici TaxID=416944 RepID=A0A1G6JWU9_9BURK|nr:Type VI secretion system (T6SS), amidase effector protein 4 [Paraburkholderia lycopersici]
MPNKKTVVKTNSTPGSVKEVPLNAVTFQELWSNYPSGDPYDNPAYKDQCAIRMSVTFHRVGIQMKSFSEKLIKPLSGQKSIGRIVLDGLPTATRADELGEWLRLQPFAGLPKAEDITGPEWESRVKGRTGIIQFSRYWAREGEGAANATGGHIDL